MKLSRRTLIVISVVITALLVVFSGYRLLFTTNKGAISQNSAPALEQDLTSDKVLEGKTMRLTHKGSYTPQSLPTSDGDIEIYKLSAKSGNASDFIISVSTLPDGTLSSNSAYILRTARTDFYEKRVAEYPAGQVQLFLSRNDHEIVAFLQRDDKVAVLSFVQADTLTQKLMPAVDWVLKSFTWKE